MTPGQVTGLFVYAMVPENFDFHVRKTHQMHQPTSFFVRFNTLEMTYLTSCT